MNIKISKSIEIGKSVRPLIVAEISGNHNGKKEKFLKLIRSAAKNGADMIKIQTYEPDDITINSKEAKFMIKDSNLSPIDVKLFPVMSLNDEDTIGSNEYCKYGTAWLKGTF